jgi:hypothetical protein
MNLFLKQIFLSSRAIYLLVFDLTKDLDQPSESNKVIIVMEEKFIYNHMINKSPLVSY